MPKSDNQKAKLFALYKILHDYTDENNGLSMAEIIAKLESDYDIVAERRSIALPYWKRYSILKLRQGKAI